MYLQFNKKPGYFHKRVHSLLFHLLKHESSKNCENFVFWLKFLRVHVDSLENSVLLVFSRCRQDVVAVAEYTRDESSCGVGQKFPVAKKVTFSGE